MSLGSLQHFFNKQQITELVEQMILIIVHPHLVRHDPHPRGGMGTLSTLTVLP